METVIKKLSEIEIAAKKIMAEANAQLSVLTQQMRDKTATFDAQVEKNTDKKLTQLHHSLQEKTDTALSKLKSDTERLVASSEAYYTKNHDRLSDEIYKKIIRM